MRQKTLPLQDQPTYVLSRDYRILLKELGGDHHLIRSIKSELRRRVNNSNSEIEIKLEVPQQNS